MAAVIDLCETLFVFSMRKYDSVHPFEKKTVESNAGEQKLKQLIYARKRKERGGGKLAPL